MVQLLSSRGWDSPVTGIFPCFPGIEVNDRRPVNIIDRRSGKPLDEGETVDVASHDGLLLQFWIVAMRPPIFQYARWVSLFQPVKAKVLLSNLRTRGRVE
jgi:hypothetical protein